MPIAVGSMLVKGIFKGGSLITGLAQTVTGLKQTEQEGKSTRTEMGRMTGVTKKLAGAFALIGVGGFTALMMTAPQLAAALFKIKMQLKLLAWSIGRHLKPLLDSVSKILKGIRTGDWSMIADGLRDAWSAVKGLISTAWDWIKSVYKSIWDQLLSGIDKPQWVTDIENWVLELERIIKEKDWAALWTWAIAPFKAVWNKFLETEMGGMVGKLLEEITKEEASIISIGTYIGEGILKGIYSTLTDPLSNLLSMKKTRDTIHEQVTVDKRGFGGGWQTAGMIPTTGLYHMHAGETVTSAGSAHHGTNASGNTTINLDFTGAEFKLASGVDIQTFAETLSEQIAASQQDVNY